MSKSKDQVTALLAAIKRQPAEVEKRSETNLSERTKQEQEIERVQEVSRSAKVAAPVTSKRGSAFQFWMHPEDRKLLRELSAWLAGQGIRASDSMVIRAVLRQARTGDALIAAYWDATKLDGRIKLDGV